MSVTETLQEAHSTAPIETKSLHPVSATGVDVSDDLLFDGTDLIKGLTSDPRVVSPVYFYDDRGSRLFEELCQEPSYYLYRTELALLSDHAMSIAESLEDCAIVELGCGNAMKTKTLLRALSIVQDCTHYLPIDVNRSFVLAAGHALARDLPNLRVEALVGTYDVALETLASRRNGSQRRCFLSLGSSIGNFEDKEIVDLIQRILLAGDHGDRLLLGIDLDKDKETLERAYSNQTAILTNFAVLEHINWRFGANFDLFKFRVRSTYNSDLHRIEEEVESLLDQSIDIPKLNFSFELSAGERIRTEISRKFVMRDLVDLLGHQGFAFRTSWRDKETHYALCLFERIV